MESLIRSSWAKDGLAQPPAAEAGIAVLPVLSLPDACLYTNAPSLSYCPL